MQSPLYKVSLGFLYRTCGDSLYHHGLQERQTGKNFNFGLQKKKEQKISSQLVHAKLTIDGIPGVEISKKPRSW